MINGSYLHFFYNLIVVLIYICCFYGHNLEGKESYGCYIYHKGKVRVLYYVTIFTDRVGLDLSDGTIRFQSKVMMKKLLKVTEYLRCGKARSFQTIKDID